jgi:hypothetical protein
MCARAHACSSLADFSTLKMDAIRSSETSVHTRSARHHIPEDSILHSNRCENLKSCNNLFYRLENFRCHKERSIDKDERKREANGVRLKNVRGTR